MKKSSKLMILFFRSKRSFFKKKNINIMKLTLLSKKVIKMLKIITF